MLFLSTRGKTDLVCSAHAITRGMADDGGLFVPQKFVAVPLEDIIALHNLSYQERAVKIISLFLTDYSEEELADAAARAYDAELNSAAARHLLCRLTTTQTRLNCGMGLRLLLKIWRFRFCRCF